MRQLGQHTLLSNGPWAKENNKFGNILLIDFEKAYDSLSFAFIKKCLKFWNFGDGHIEWLGNNTRVFMGI